MQENSEKHSGQELSKSEATSVNQSLNITENYQIKKKTFFPSPFTTVTFQINSESSPLSASPNLSRGRNSRALFMPRVHFNGARATQQGLYIP